MDVFCREALAIEIGQRQPGENVVEVMNCLVARKKAPRYLFVDNGGKFSGHMLDLWAYHYKARIDFSRPHMAINDLTPNEFARNIGLLSDTKVSCAASYDAKALSISGTKMKAVQM